MAVTLTAVSPDPIDTRGGTKMTATGTFPAVALRVFLGPAGTTSDPPCYSGVVGSPLDVVSEDGTTLTFVAAPTTKGARFVTIAEAGDLGENDTVGVTVLERNWPSKVHAMRKNCPRWYETGPRSLNLEERL